MQCNGWTNYETYVIHTWIANDESMCEEVTRIVSAAQDKDAATEAITQWVIDNNPLANTNTLYMDLLDGSLSVVNYAELAAAFWEDKPDDDDADDNDAPEPQYPPDGDADQYEE